ncbi:hypothetical protein A0H81_02076 [Grifola frondosa]|uniref:Uncharacterized protein n=1 Tax=Grifola frondosa TaxID=5627 RepID=A0A1C7MM69_GRIFR|nr:hypothetical protein A0H81_02076 [Grifola frondosa]
MRSVRHLELHRLEFSWISDVINSVLAFSELSSIVTENINWRSYSFDKFLDDYPQHEDRGKLIIATLCYDRYVCGMSHALSNTLVDLRLIPSAFPSSFRLGRPTVHPAHLPKLETLSIAIPSMDGYELIHDLLLHLDAPRLHSIELQHAFRDYPRYQCDSMLKLLDTWFGPIFANPARVFPALKSITIAFPDFAWKENDSWWSEKIADVFPQCSGRNMLHVRIDRTQYN